MSPIVALCTCFVSKIDFRGRTASHVYTAVGVKVGHVHAVGQFAADGGSGPRRFLLLEGVVVGIVPMGGNLLGCSAVCTQHQRRNILFRIKFRFRFLRGRIGNLRLAGRFVDFRQIILAGWKKLHIFLCQIGDTVHLGHNTGIG